MQQTLLTICALLCFGLFALGRHRANAQNERDAIGGEVELMVTEQARALLTRVTALTYDEADVGATRPRTDATGLSTTLGPEAGETNVDNYNDADDWNGYSAPLTATWDAGDTAASAPAAAQAFTAAVVVRYVSPTNPSATSGSPTMAKEVVVTITEAVTPQGRPAARATLRQVITPSMR